MLVAMAAAQDGEVSMPSDECLTIDAFNYDEYSASLECIAEWMDFDDYCWSLEDYDDFCNAGYQALADAIEPATMPTDDEECMTEAAFNWSDDYCGYLWQEFDEWCFILDSFDQKQMEKQCEPVNDAYFKYIEKNGTGGAAELVMRKRATIVNKNRAARQLLATTGMTSQAASAENSSNSGFMTGVAAGSAVAVLAFFAARNCRKQTDVDADFHRI